MKSGNDGDSWTLDDNSGTKQMDNNTTIEGKITKQTCAEGSDYDECQGYKATVSHTDSLREKRHCGFVSR